MNDQPAVRPGTCPHHGQQDQVWDPEAEFYFCPRCRAATAYWAAALRGDLAAEGPRAPLTTSGTEVRLIHTHTTGSTNGDHCRGEHPH